MGRRAAAPVRGAGIRLGQRANPEVAVGEHHGAVTAHLGDAVRTGDEANDECLMRLDLVCQRLSDVARHGVF